MRINVFWVAPACARFACSAATLTHIQACDAAQDIMIGDECQEQRHNLEVTYPVTNGIVQNWRALSTPPAAAAQG